MVEMMDELPYSPENEQFPLIADFTLNELLIEAIESKASDVHITVGMPPLMRVNGLLTKMRDYVLKPEHTAYICLGMLNEKQKEILEEKGEVDFSYGIPNVSRFRVNIYRQRKSLTAAIRIIMTSIPTIDSLNLPPILKQLAVKPRGLILVTGPTGSGKSTTLAAMVDFINNQRSCHILTLEEPIEYLHKHKTAMINQREIGDDSTTFATGLRAALREDPDVILVGEMRDLETISTALTAAETGHLVFATLHTPNALQTMERMISVFPASDQNQIIAQLANSIEGVIAQLLLPRANKKGRVLATEILVATSAVRNYIRTGESHKLGSVLQTGRKWGMQTMDMCLDDLYERAEITHDLMLAHKTQRDPDRPTEGLQRTGFNRS